MYLMFKHYCNTNVKVPITLIFVAVYVVLQYNLILFLDCHELGDDLSYDKLNASKVQSCSSVSEEKAKR
jgi:hypothetical protein